MSFSSGTGVGFWAVKHEASLSPRTGVEFGAVKHRVSFRFGTGVEFEFWNWGGLSLLLLNSVCFLVLELGLSLSSGTRD